MRWIDSYLQLTRFDLYELTCKRYVGAWEIFTRETVLPQMKCHLGEGMFSYGMIYHQDLFDITDSYLLLTWFDLCVKTFGN